MAITNYGQLKAIASDWMDRTKLLDSVTIDGTKFWPMDVFCGHVEAECNRKLRTEDMATVIFNSGCDDQQYVLLPDNILGMRIVTLNGANTEYLTPEQFIDAENLYCGVPFYTRVANQIHVHPEMKESDDLTIVAYVTLPPLVNDPDVNWMLRKFPDVYLYGMLYEACAYLYDTENELKWKQKFDIAIQDLIDGDAGDNWSGSTMRVRSA